MLKVIEKTKLWFTISLVIIIIGLGCIAFKGLNFGIDFVGGTVLSVDLGKQVDKQDIDETKQIVEQYVDKDSYEIREVNNTGIELTIRSEAIEDEQVGELTNEIIEEFEVLDENFSEETIGSVIGKELTRKAWISVIVASVLMLIYIGIRFEFKFGLAAIVALIHDILITLSVYAIFGLKLNSPFIAAMLTILGYSINDTIVLFDRIRENKKKLGKVSYEELANTSINQTMSRTINTSISTLLTITCVLILVPSIRELTIPLIVGVISGSYSSIFIASPMWVWLKKRENKVNA